MLRIPLHFTGEVGARQNEEVWNKALTFRYRRLAHTVGYSGIKTYTLNRDSNVGDSSLELFMDEKSLLGWLTRLARTDVKGEDTFGHTEHKILPSSCDNTL